MNNRLLLAGLVLAVSASTAAVVPGHAAPQARAAAAPADSPGGPHPDWPPAAPSRLVIDTGGAPIGREDYVEGTVTLDGRTHATGVRGRGNSTWSWAKKPYKLELEEDAALVGDQEHDEWVLLAGYADRSALRTATAFAIAARTGLAWTPRFRFVDVVLDGQPLGLYLLTEQVEEGEGRVELPDDGYLLEINHRYLRDDEPGFRTGRGTPVAFKDPDEVTRTQRREVRRAVTRFEKVLYGPRFTDPRRGYARYVDVKRVIDWYLVQELFRNQDSNFRSSVNISWVPGQKFVFGPVWDFDLSAGTRWKAQAGTEGWLTRVGEHWISRMLEDPAFSARVKSRWARLRPVVDQVVAQIPAAAVPISQSAEADWQLWHASGDLEWTRHAASHGGEVSHLQGWLTARARWLSRNEVRTGRRWMHTRERERTVWVPVTLHSAPTSAVGVPYEVVGGTASAGTDVVADSGRLEFGAGQRLRYLPVRILDDAEREPAETVLVRLGETADGPVPGTPDLTTITIAAND